MHYVLVSVKLRTGWDNWQSMGGFSFQMPKNSSFEEVARRARFVVDRQYENTVTVQVLNPETRLYDQEFLYYPIGF